MRTTTTIPLFLTLLAAVVWHPSVMGARLQRRTLDRFRVGTPENQVCWDRWGDDGFFSVVDAHNHFRPFGGPAVPFQTYLSWMEDHGILFSTIFGIGQLIHKSRGALKNCCYYLHCPTLDYRVMPDPTNDRLNAEKHVTYLADSNMTSKIHLTLSATFVNLQKPANNVKTLNKLINDFPGAFRWAGEINVFKHALVTNGFFDPTSSPRVTVARLPELDRTFRRLSLLGWPVTLHCDLGCDNYDSIPVDQDVRNPIKKCFVPEAELKVARRNIQFWKDILGPHYGAFFDANNIPIQATFRKIQHLHVWDSLLSRYPNMKVVWAHLGLSKELRDLHPVVHLHILTTLFDRHTNLHADTSWDVLPHMILMNFQNNSISGLLHTSHEDFVRTASHLLNHTEIAEIREKLQEVWLDHKEDVHASGSIDKVLGPSYKMAMYLDVMNRYPDRFLTGSDFVASFAAAKEYPGTKAKPNGCMKDKANHARQVTDTGSMNMFFSDEAFRKIVLGENFFRLTNLQDQFSPPPLCEDSAVSAWAIVGIVLLALLVIVIIAAIVAFAIYKCKK